MRAFDGGARSARAALGGRLRKRDGGAHDLTHHRDEHRFDPGIDGSGHEHQLCDHDDRRADHHDHDRGAGAR